MQLVDMAADMLTSLLIKSERHIVSSSTEQTGLEKRDDLIKKRQGQLSVLHNDDSVSNIVARRESRHKKPLSQWVWSKSDISFLPCL